jgi:hypothetical protein
MDGLVPDSREGEEDRDETRSHDALEPAHVLCSDSDLGAGLRVGSAEAADLVTQKVLPLVLAREAAQATLTVCET